MSLSSFTPRPRENLLEGTTISRGIDGAAYLQLLKEHTLPEKGNYNKKYINSIQYYSHVGHRFNRSLRQLAEGMPEKGYRGVITTAEKLDKAMQPSSIDITVLRGYVIDKGQTVSVGDTFPHASYMGTTPNLKEARRFSSPTTKKDGIIFELSVLAGTPYIPLIKYTTDPYHWDKWAAREAEILWGRGLTITVTEIVKQYTSVKGVVTYVKAIVK